MKINNEFTVGVPAEQAWDIMLDLERIASCVPGAGIQESRDDGEYAGTMKVKIGPITANYKGTVKIEEANEENRRAVLKATGRDARGQGTASATIVSTLQEEGEGTRVNVKTDMRLTGRAAQFGRGIAQDVATKMLGQFAGCLERKIGGSQEEAAASSAMTETSGDVDGAASQETDSEMPIAGVTEGTSGRVISSEDPSVMAGGTVEGVVISEGAPGAATSAEQPRAEQAPRREPEEPEAFDLGAASQEAVLKRVKQAAPVAAAVWALVVLWLILRR